ncbi:hypothetical protein GCK32_020832 [Trichostrongylus colubriformis]|uniref:Uncharacterized protein n=1 Tax=Trichostrongylus colubriformis TaxID=6319 RepID=A0AAN8FJS1_TRICO
MCFTLCCSSSRGSQTITASHRWMSRADTPSFAATELHLTQEQVNAYNEALLEYGFHVLYGSLPLMLDTSLLTAHDRVGSSLSCCVCRQYLL